MTQNSAHTGKLYVVGTPIGNLGDLSPRVARPLPPPMSSAAKTRA